MWQRRTCAVMDREGDVKRRVQLDGVLDVVHHKLKVLWPTKRGGGPEQRRAMVRENNPMGGQWYRAMVVCVVWMIGWPVGCVGPLKWC